MISSKITSGSTSMLFLVLICKPWMMVDKVQILHHTSMFFLDRPIVLHISEILRCQMVITKMHLSWTIMIYEACMQNIMGLGIPLKQRCAIHIDIIGRNVDAIGFSF